MNELIKNLESKMKDSLFSLINEYKNIRSSRANPAILDKIMIEYYGVMTPILQVGAVSVPEAKTILIQPFDISTLSLIEKAIQKSDIGINPNNDGKCLRLVFPPPSEERRKELVKEVNKKLEEAKISIRNIRREGLEKIKNSKKKSEITEDEQRKNENTIQKLVHEYEEKLEKVAIEKTKEIETI